LRRQALKDETGVPKGDREAASPDSPGALGRGLWQIPPLCRFRLFKELERSGKYSIVRQQLMGGAELGSRTEVSTQIDRFPESGEAPGDCFVAHLFQLIVQASEFGRSVRFSRWFGHLALLPVEDFRKYDNLLRNRSLTGNLRTKGSIVNPLISTPVTFLRATGSG